MTMTGAITIPDLRYEESFTAKLTLLAKNGKRNGNDEITAENDDFVDVPISIIIKSIIIDQIIMPFVQSFALAGVLYYLRPLLRYSTQSGYYFATSIVKSIKQLYKKTFYAGL